MSNTDKLLNKFLADAKVREYLSYSDDINIFNILGINEHHNSNMLAWLLDPRGSHLHGDHYLKALMYAAYKFMPNDKESRAFKKSCSYVDMDWMSLSNAIVEREVALDKSNFIDLMVFDYDNELAIFIETKVSAPHDEKQLARYLKVASKRFPQIKHKLFVFLHYEEMEVEKAASPWLGLTFDWLAEAITNRPNNLMPDYSHVDRTLDFYNDWLADRYTFRNWNVYQDATSYIALEYADFLSELKKEVLQCKDSWSEVIDGDNTQLFYVTNKEKLQCLFDYSRWEHIGEQIKKNLSDYNIDFNFGNNYVIIHNEDWRKYYTLQGIYNSYLWVVIREVTPIPPKKTTAYFDIALRCDMDELKKPVRDKLCSSFKKTMRVKQLEKISVSMPIKPNQDWNETSLLKIILTDITEMLEKIESCAS